MITINVSMKVVLYYYCTLGHKNIKILSWDEDSSAYEIDGAMEKYINPPTIPKNDGLALRPKPLKCKKCYFSHNKNIKYYRWIVINSPNQDWINSQLKERPKPRKNYFGWYV